MPHRSPNCKTYTDTVSVFVDGTASVPGKEGLCTLDMSPTFSCQTSGFEQPDLETKMQMRRKAATELNARPGCAVSSPMDLNMTFTTNLVGAQAMEYSAEKLTELGMTSNCFREGNDPNHATHIGKAECYPQREMTDTQGRRVMNTNMQVFSGLAVCDTSEKAMPQVQEDLRKVAAHNLLAKGYKVDAPEDMACSFAILPHL